TFSEEIRSLAKGILKDPIEISVSPKNSTAVAVEQTIYEVDKARKTSLLTHLIQEQQWQQALVFSKTKHGADRLVRQLLSTGISAAVIHGNKSQNQRTEALAGFKQGKTQILVATDIAARGIDIDQLPHVVNFDLPQVAEDYVHRIGRTGRAGASGHAISLVCADEAKQLLDIEKLIKRKFQRQQVDGFEPDHSVPHTAPKQKPVQNNNQAARGNKARTTGAKVLPIKPKASKNLKAAEPGSRGRSSRRPRSNQRKTG
ncbi:MAG TPA: helicase-related protein, partial [Thiolinea sp.]|nr:helicase-related protein [Thiolinea sp.]